MIVRLDEDSQLSVQQLADKHVIRTIIDGVQAASNYLWVYHAHSIAFDAKHFFQRYDIESTIPRAFAPHKLNAPDSEWVVLSVDNYMWLIQYLTLLGTEFQCRFTSVDTVNNQTTKIALSSCLKIIDQLPRFDFHQAPLDYPSSIDSWVNEYRANKHRLTWHTRVIPEWVD